MGRPGQVRVTSATCPLRCQGARRRRCSCGFQAQGAFLLCWGYCSSSEPCPLLSALVLACCSCSHCQPARHHNILACFGDAVHVHSWGRTPAWNVMPAILRQMKNARPYKFGFPDAQALHRASAGAVRPHLRGGRLAWGASTDAIVEPFTHGGGTGHDAAEQRAQRQRVRQRGQVRLPRGLQRCQIGRLQAPQQAGLLLLHPRIRKY